MPVYKITHASDPNWYVIAPTIKQAIEVYEEASGNTHETESVERVCDRHAVHVESQANTSPSTTSS